MERWEVQFIVINCKSGCQKRTRHFLCLRTPSKNPKLHFLSIIYFIYNNLWNLHNSISELNCDYQFFTNFSEDLPVDLWPVPAGGTWYRSLSDPSTGSQWPGAGFGGLVHRFLLRTLVMSSVRKSVQKMSDNISDKMLVLIKIRYLEGLALVSKFITLFITVD